MVDDGAREIDIVISRGLALTGDWQAVYDEVKLFKEACEEKQKVLREKLGKLHERLEEVYDNYALTQHAIHDGLRTTLTDVQMEKDFRVA